MITSALTKSIQFFKKQIFPNGVKTLNDSFKDFETIATVASVYDGDTITCIFASSMSSTPIAWKCRLCGIDCPEIMSKNPEEKEHAILAKKYVENMILDKKVFIKCKGLDKYGRVLVSVFVNSRMVDVDENDPNIYTLNLNDALVDKAYAKKYDGRTKEPWVF